jgi:hypothetical protein
VLRFWSHEVLAEGRAILDRILAALEGKFPERDDASASILLTDGNGFPNE